jgi:cytochrome oxidase Cu insertion factor (SCO1/SenC/PrrC family)
MLKRKSVQILIVVSLGFCVYALHNFIVRTLLSDYRIGNIISFGIYFISGIMFGILKSKSKLLSDLTIYIFLLVGIFFDVQGLFQNQHLFPIITPISTLSKVFGFYLGFNILKRTKAFYIVLITLIPVLLYISLIYIPQIEYNEQKNEFDPKLKQVNFSSLRTQNGDTINSCNLKGKVVLLDFFFINCRPCLQKFPTLEKLKSAFKNRDDVEIIGVYCDVDHSMEKLPAFLEKNKITMTTLYDKDLESCKKLGINSYPVEIILNRKGEIVSTYWGFSLTSSEKYLDERIKLINELLKNN